MIPTVVRRLWGLSVPPFSLPPSGRHMDASFHSFNRVNHDAIYMVLHPVLPILRTVFQQIGVTYIRSVPSTFHTYAPPPRVQSWNCNWCRCRILKRWHELDRSRPLSGKGTMLTFEHFNILMESHWASERRRWTGMNCSADQIGL